MRAYLPSYEMLSPKSMTEALSILAKDPGVYRPFAGGTDLMVLYESGKLNHKKLMSIWGLPELQGIHVDAEFVSMGALTTYRKLREHPTITKEYSALVTAAKMTGAWAIQSRGTIGGNIMNASPAADSPPALLIYDAEVELTSTRGSRWVPYDAFHTGYKTTQAKNDELLTKIRLPRKSSLGEIYYRKVGTRQAQAISKVCMASKIVMNSGVVKEFRLAFGAVAPIPYRAKQTESVLVGQSLNEKTIQQALAQLHQEIAPIDDIRSTKQYRLQVAKNLLEDCLRHVGTSRSSS